MTVRTSASSSSSSSGSAAGSRATQSTLHSSRNRISQPDDVMILLKKFSSSSDLRLRRISIIGNVALLSQVSEVIESFVVCTSMLVSLVVQRFLLATAVGIHYTHPHHSLRSPSSVTGYPHNMSCMTYMYMCCVRQSYPGDTFGSCFCYRKRCIVPGR